MDHIMRGLLNANVVEVQYFRLGFFPTRGLFTLNKNFINEPELLNEVDGDSFFSAFEILRNRVVTFDNEEEVLSTNVFNPHGLDPMQLWQQGLSADKKDVKRGIDDFRGNRLQSITSVGDVSKLSLKSKATLIDLFMATGNSITSPVELSRHIEDIYFADPTIRTMTQLRYGFFFAMDYEWKSDEEALRFAAEKWFALIDVYKELFLQTASDRTKQNIQNIKYPDLDQFDTYEKIIDYWPYALTPRPIEILESHLVAIYETNASTVSDKAS